jgi:putative transposase
MLSVL